MQTRRLATSFKGLNSLLSQSPGKLWSCKNLPDMGILYFSKARKTTEHHKPKHKPQTLNLIG